MLELGLQRISKLVTASSLPWRAIHVAGTNGKGSVCAYAASLLKAAGVPAGRFTSPHLIDRWDCISIDGKAINENHFLAIEDQVRWKDRRLKVDATEFELLTATAFEAFTQQKVDVGVVEVGLGGRRDATNVLQNPLVTVITRIAMDHQSLLGNSLEQIATEKAGIMKPGAPCFVDYENEHSVGPTLLNCAASQGAGRLQYVRPDSIPPSPLWTLLDRKQYAHQQQVSIALSYHAIQSVLEQLGVSCEPEVLIPSIASTTWPGRLQWLRLSTVTTRVAQVLLDGAHNLQAAQALAVYINHSLRQPTKSASRGTPVTWVLAASQGKDVQAVFGALLQDGDRVITTEFGSVDGMPWVSSVEAEVLSQRLEEHLGNVQVQNVVVRSSPDLHSALRWAANLAGEGPLVIAGSLYLAADVLRLLRKYGDRQN